MKQRGYRRIKSFWMICSFETYLLGEGGVMLSDIKTQGFNRKWLLVILLLGSLGMNAFAGDENQATIEEAQRLTEAFESFSSSELERIPGPGVFKRVLNRAWRFIETMPLVGEYTSRHSDDIFTEEDLNLILSSQDKESRDVEGQLSELYHSTVMFVAKASSQETVADEVQVQLNQLMKKVGEVFGKMTKGFQDALPPPQGLEAYVSPHDTNLESFLGHSAFVGRWFFHHMSWIGLELSALIRGEAIPLPFLEGVSERRSAAAANLARSLRDQLRRDEARLTQLNPSPDYFSMRYWMNTITNRLRPMLGLKSDIRTPEQVMLSLTALEALLNGAKNSELMREGKWHRTARRFYLALAAYFVWFGGPEVGPLFGPTFGLAERTTMGALVGMVQWVGLSGWLARSRTTNSGLAFYNAVQGRATWLPRFAVGLRKEGLSQQVERLKATAYSCMVQFRK